MTKPQPTSLTPNPGSPDAIAQGCICPVLDNARGIGYMGIPGNLVIVEGCPLHCSEEVTNYSKTLAVRKPPKAQPEKGFGSRPQYLLRMQTDAGAYKIPYDCVRQRTQLATDERACAISRLMFAVLQFPENPENLRLLAEVVSEGSAEAILELGLELSGQEFKARTFSGKKIIQLLATSEVDGWQLKSRDVALDVAIAS